ncbi:MAG: TIR domain-containing protein [Rubrivivax sp.]|nr:TIR domain-containing protein [Rubrivivax sp.]
MINSLAQSQYTAFISYAHADDVRCHRWVSFFAEELQRGLEAVMRGVALPPVHLSGDNGPVAGVLGPELRERIDRSFAFVVVVHDNYVQSDWCRQELEYFCQRFGEEGCRERLYVLALSEPAVQKVTAGDTWQRLVPAGQLWMPFFAELDRDEPIDIYMAPQLVTGAFKTMFNRLREDFVAKLKAAQAPQQQPIASLASLAAVAAAAAPAPPAPLGLAALGTGTGPAVPVTAARNGGAAPPAGDVRIYIESNRHELTLWQPLGEQMRRRWQRLTTAAAPAAAGAAGAAAPAAPGLQLRPRGLPVEQIDQFPSLDDADGVVLLWGRKTPDALVAQINKVENKMSAGRDAAPGVVAYLMPPQSSAEPVPAWGWQVLRFDAQAQDRIDVVTEEDAELEGFLKRVLERRLQREAQAPAAPAGRG